MSAKTGQLISVRISKSGMDAINVVIFFIIEAVIMLIIDDVSSNKSILIHSVAAPRLSPDMARNTVIQHAGTVPAASAFSKRKIFLLPAGIV